jgi:hypothetical protein
MGMMAVGQAIETAVKRMVVIFGLLFAFSLLILVAIESCESDEVAVPPEMPPRDDQDYSYGGPIAPILDPCAPCSESGKGISKAEAIELALCDFEISPRVSSGYVMFALMKDGCWNIDFKFSRASKYGNVPRFVIDPCSGRIVLKWYGDGRVALSEKLEDLPGFVPREDWPLDERNCARWDSELRRSATGGIKMYLPMRNRGPIIEECSVKCADADGVISRIDAIYIAKAHANQFYRRLAFRGFKVSLDIEQYDLETSRQKGCWRVDFQPESKMFFGSLLHYVIDPCSGEIILWWLG